MTDGTTWEELNSDYLSCGLAWLRGRLANPSGPPTESAPWWEAERFSVARVPPALELLGDRFGLTRFERNVLLLVAASELDPGLMAASSRDGERRVPSFALALVVLPEPAWDVVSPHRPLRRWRLLEMDESRLDSLTGTRLRIDERILSFLKGLNFVDERISQVLKPVYLALAEPLPVSHEETVGRVLEALTQPTGVDPPPVIELVGIDSSVSRSLATSAAGRISHQMYELRPERIPLAQDELVGLLRLWERETMLLPVVLYVDVSHLVVEESASILAAIEDFSGYVMVGCREQWAFRTRRTRVVDTARPTAGEQEELWASRLGGDTDTAARLASEFDFDQVTIADVAGLGPLETGRLWASCRAQARPRLDTLARRISPGAGWSELVLPADDLRMLHHLVDQVRGRAQVLRHWGFDERVRRGSAVTALFAGPSGTGKTLAAEVVAHELDLDLYKIDLAGIVSKYIGETERNLRRVFDAAEDGGALLLFDEADALFGKRSEVKDSHDRYANIEVNYLLARIEDFRGTAILATNQRHALDEAFLRRLRLVVHFPFPARPERALLWARAFPARAPVEGLDVERLSTLSTSGGMIRNIALNSAFCAAGRGAPVTMEILLEMARAEFKKLELPINESDFRLAPVA
jgi:ATPase family associated with various cellular activities (AAA)